MLENNSNVDPICAACKENIGAMPLDIYLRAIAARGEYLFCPDCRTHKCDCCGWFIPTQTMQAVYSDEGQFLGNACETCVTWVLPLDDEGLELPYFRTMQKPNLKWVRAYSDYTPELTEANEGEGIEL
jgi:hypothetical protein